MERVVSFLSTVSGVRNGCSNTKIKPINKVYFASAELLTAISLAIRATNQIFFKFVT